MTEIKPFSEDISRGSEDILRAEEIKLNLGSKQWQDLRKEIARWKASGGTLHAKMVGKPDAKEIEELVAKRGPRLTDEEEARIYQTPGVIPPWFPDNPHKESYFYHAKKAIEELGVSAAEVLAAVDKEYEDWKALTPKQKDILKSGWDLDPVYGEKSFSEDISYGQETDEFAMSQAGSIVHLIKGWETGKRINIDAALDILRDMGKTKKDYLISKGLFRQAQAAVTDYIKSLQKHVADDSKGFARMKKQDAIKEIKEIKKLLTVRYPALSKTATKSTATNLAKHLLTKQGLKVTAKTFGKIVGKLSGTLMSPWLIPLIWSPEIIDIATSKDVQKIWKNMQSEQWWKEAAGRDEIVREKIKQGEKVVFSKNVIPYGEFYHKDKGWY